MLNKITCIAMLERVLLRLLSAGRKRNAMTTHAGGHVTRSPALNLFILAPPGRARISSNPRRLNWKTDFTLVSQGKRFGLSSYLIVF